MEQRLEQARTNAEGYAFRFAAFDPNKREDMVQEGLVKVIQALQQDPDLPDKVIRKIIWNAMIDQVRKERPELPYLTLQFRPAPDPLPSVDNQIVIASVLSRLKPEFAQALLTWAEYFESEACAEILGITPKTFKNRVDRARAKCRQMAVAA